MKFLSVLFSLVAIVGIYSIVGTVEATDRVQAQVLDVIGNEVIVEDLHGNIYSFADDEYISGQWLDILFFNGGDTNPANDKIIEVTVIK